ncbi:MAG TPA: 4Fe-4S dicluster domain-containing protein [Candidatus Nanoarchaeia archaeon]|nr:4Fe-4S dicluster domain-containing protein [Candidatus Nanoarchaeia archaeon]
MVKITINKERCKECSFCVAVCPIKLIKISSKLNKRGYHYAELIDDKKCTGCAQCYQMCPDMCITIEK